MNKALAIIILGLVLSSCQTKTYVIPEWDGEREIRWYTTEKQ